MNTLFNNPMKTTSLVMVDDNRESLKLSILTTEKHYKYITKMQFSSSTSVSKVIDEMKLLIKRDEIIKFILVETHLPISVEQIEENIHELLPALQNTEVVEHNDRDKQRFEKTHLIVMVMKPAMAGRWNIIHKRMKNLSKDNGFYITRMII